MKRLLMYILILWLILPLYARGEENYGSSGLGVPADISGYFDMVFQGTDKTGERTAFKQNHLSIFIGKRIENWRFFSETEFEYAPKFEGDGASPVEGRGEVLVETAWLEYEHNDAINLRTGLLLIPTYWRVNHYPSFTVSTSRPLIDKMIFPPDIVGAMFYGIRFFRDLGIEYRLYGGNGDSDFQGKTDPNNNKAIGLKLVAHIPSSLLHIFNIGGHYYIDKDKNGEDVDVYGGEVVMEKGPFSLLGEYAYADSGGKTGFYIQPSINLSTRVIFFYRYDDRDIDSTQDADKDQQQHTVGLNFKPIPEISLKTEYFRVEPDASNIDKYNGGTGSIVIFF